MTNPPHFKGFKPIELREEMPPVVINYEEYEAIRLSDYELYGQVEAARMMNVSRPTFARIYEAARRKVALAFVEGKTIVFEGGKVYFDSEWYACNHCGCWFNHMEKDEENIQCALCGSTDVEQYTGENDAGERIHYCVCPGCGKEAEHIPGKPCRKEICPSCHIPMIHHIGSSRKMRSVRETPLD